jgi:hypothetical protein
MPILVFPFEAGIVVVPPPLVYSLGFSHGFSLGFAQPPVVIAEPLPPFPPDPRPSHGLRRRYVAQGIPTLYGTDVYGTPIYGTAGSIVQPLRRASPPEVRRVYPAAGVPGIYNADIFGGSTPATTPDFSSSDFSGDFARTGTAATSGSGASIYGAAGALNKPLRRTSGPQMRRTYKYPVQLIPGGIYDKDIYGQDIY